MPSGEIGPEGNRNGSARSIAGILSPNLRVLGLMPHPEDLVDPLMGGTDGKPLIIPGEGDELPSGKICTRPFAVDWDGDGHLDLVVGNMSGTFHWFKGEGKGKFRPIPEIIKTDGVPLKVDGHHSDPFVIDWDGDGALDLISGTSNGGVQWAKNRAGKGKPPDLGPFEWLIKPGRAIEHGGLLSEEDLTGPTTMTRIWVADVNGDGKLDVLVFKAFCQSANFFLNSSALTPFAGAMRVTESPTARKELSSETADQAKRNKANEEFNRIYSQRSEFMIEENTGFVWLYLQK
jgi:hypothetical protein